MALFKGFDFDRLIYLCSFRCSCVLFIQFISDYITNFKLYLWGIRTRFTMFRTLLGLVSVKKWHRGSDKWHRCSVASYHNSTEISPLFISESPKEVILMYKMHIKNSATWRVLAFIQIILKPVPKDLPEKVISPFDLNFTNKFNITTLNSQIHRF